MGNSFSFEAGEVFLEALQKRSRGNSNGVDGSPPAKKPPRVMVDIGGTALAWDRGGFTVGPPSGNMWAGLNDSRARFAPSEYEKLRGELDESCKIQYSPRGNSNVPWKPFGPQIGAGGAQQKAGSFLP